MNMGEREREKSPSRYERAAVPVGNHALIKVSLCVTTGGNDAAYKLSHHCNQTLSFGRAQKKINQQKIK
jgi:hypothetical protein